MTFFLIWQILIHLLAFEACILMLLIARHIVLHPPKRSDEQENAGTELANVTIYAPPAYGLRVVK